MPIPRRIIQTHRSESIHPEWRQSWRDHHPGYEYLFFDDARCRAFLAERLPSMLQTYDLLPMPVQKADFFRYAVIYELGGTYSDVDTICHAPLDSYIDLSQDHLVAGLEMAPVQFGGPASMYVPIFCSPFQLLQWTFSASPRHPALAVLLQRIAYLVASLTPAKLAEYSAEVRFTLELTGPMAFTQVLTDFLSGTRPGKVTVLERLDWGAVRYEQDYPDVVARMKVQHLFEGSWKPDTPTAAKPVYSISPLAPKPAPASRVHYNIRY